MYRDQLSPWCIVCLLPKMQRAIVQRFRRRGDAEGHLKALRRINPENHYTIVFDLPDEESDNSRS